MSYSWTQPYHVSMNPFYQIEKRLNVDEILNIYDEIEHIIENMDNYPDAENLIAKIKNNS